MQCPPTSEEMFTEPLNWLREACETSEAHPAAVAMHFLVAFGNLVGRGVYAYVGNFLDNDISILKINGTQVTDTGKKLKLPGHPASLRGAPK